MIEYLVLAGVVITVALIAIFFLRARRLLDSAAAAAAAPLKEAMDLTAEGLSGKFSAAMADMAERLERVKGDLRQETSDRLEKGFRDVGESVERQLAGGREQQAAALAQARSELSESLDRSSASLKEEVARLTEGTRQSLETIRQRVDEKLLAISDQVQHKLDENIKEGFQQFEKVQQSLKAAEDQLRNVSAIGSSINDLNSLLKLPHLRGRFGEASLERLLADFLPAHMYELQAVPGKDGHGRADAIIRFPERVLPIDAKFPREQVLPLFESSDPSELAAARDQFAQVVKEQARRIAAYIQPENGTTDMALMYLPSETLYMEAVLNGELSEWLNKQHVFPVSPNTLIVTLQSIQMVFKMYEFAKSFEKATDELKKAQAAFGHFENRFQDIGKSLGKAQQAYEVARGHLNRYSNRVTNLTGEAPPELPGPEAAAESVVPADDSE